MTRRNFSASLVSSLLCAGGLASASLVYVSSYSGTVSTLNLTQTQPYAHGVAARQIQQLTPIRLSHGCSDNPSWLTLDHPDATLYCIDEGLDTPDGALTSFLTSSDGSLKQLAQTRTPNGPVSSVIFGKKRHGLALAHYGGSAFTTWDISHPSALKPLETKKFKLSKPGPNPDRQDAPHPHEAVLDPTGRFLLVPDLGMDLIHIYSFDDDTLALKSLAPMNVRPGSGPRHLAFVVKHKKTFAYLVTELGNTIVGYEVTYPKGSIDLIEIFYIPSHGDGQQAPSGAAAAEIVISPDGKNLIVSSRGENDFMVPNFDPKNTTSIPSDPIINFAIDAASGYLTVLQIVPAGGRFPRQFSINKAGNILAVGLQNDGRVAFIERDVETGQLGGFVAYANIEGQITAAIFDE